MNWPIFVRRLVDLAPGRAPTDEEVHAALLAAADDEDERELFVEDEAGVEVLREYDHDATREPLVRLAWQPGAAFASSVTVEWVAGEGCGLLVGRNDYDPEVDFAILACVAGPLASAPLAERVGLLVSSLRDGSVPDWITNYVPELLSADVLREAYRALDPQTIAGDPVRHVFDRLADLPARARARRWLPREVSLRDALARLEVLVAAGARELAAEDRRLLADVYFALTYVESAPA